MKLNTILFILLLVFSTSIRFWKLNEFPIALNWDEVSHGYNAYSVLLTGKDQWGNVPIFNFRAYGDYPTTLNLYLTIPFVRLFGLNEWSIRLPSAILGTATIVSVYFLGLYLFSSTQKALLLAFIFAISPWSFFPSRAVFQSTVAQFFLVTGATLILSRRLLIGSLLFAISAYGYHNTRIIAPLIYPILMFYPRPKIQKTHLFAIAIFALITLPSIFHLLTPESRARNAWVGIIDQGAISYLEQQRNLRDNSLASKIIFNKPTYFAFSFTRNYLVLLNPVNLFFRSTNNYQFNIPGFGILLPVWLPFFYLGLFLALKKHRYLVLSFLICLLPSAITRGDFPVIRAMSSLPLPQVFILLGFEKLLSHLPRQRRSILLLFIGLSVFQFTSYLRHYFLTYPTQYASSWQYGYKEVVSYLKNNYSQYNQIFITKKYGEPHEYILFFWPWNPRSYQTDPTQNWDYHANWYWVNAFDKFKFINDWEIENHPLPPHSLLVTSPNNYPPNTKKLVTINYQNGDKVFDIVTNDQ